MHRPTLFAQTHESLTFQGKDTAQIASSLSDSRSLDSLRAIVRALGQRLDMIDGQGQCPATRYVASYI